MRPHNVPAILVQLTNTQIHHSEAKRHSYWYRSRDKEKSREKRGREGREKKENQQKTKRQNKSTDRWQVWPWQCQRRLRALEQQHCAAFSAEIANPKKRKKKEVRRHSDGGSGLCILNSGCSRIGFPRKSPPTLIITSELAAFSQLSFFHRRVLRVVVRLATTVTTINKKRIDVQLCHTRAMILLHRLAVSGSHCLQ